MAGRPQEHTPEEIAQALTDSSGLITVAAKKLRVSHQTVRNYLKRYPELQQVVDDARDDLIDIAESAMLDLVRQKDFRACSFILKTLGKSRGYIEKQELDLSGDVTVRLPTVYLPVKVSDDSDELTDNPLPQGYTPPVQPVGIFTPPTPQPQITQTYTPPTPQAPKQPLLWRPPGTVSQESE